MLLLLPIVVAGTSCGLLDIGPSPVVVTTTAAPVPGPAAPPPDVEPNEDETVDPSPAGFDTVSGQYLPSEGVFGRDLLLWFWEPGCDSCVEQGAEVVEVANGYVRDIRVFGMVGRGLPAEQQEFVRRSGTESLVSVIVDPDQLAALDVVAAPSFVFINDDGTHVTRFGDLGVDEVRSEMNRLLRT